MLFRSSENKVTPSGDYSPPPPKIFKTRSIDLAAVFFLILDILVVTNNSLSTTVLGLIGLDQGLSWT